MERDQGGTDNWGEVALLLASDGTAGDALGVAVALDGDIAIGGASGADPGGAAYVYERDAGGIGNWGEVEKLRVADAHLVGNFGVAAALSGVTMVVGAPSGGPPGRALLIEPRTVQMFVTQADYAPDFGGLAGGDAICRTEADAAGQPGLWKALLSVTGVDKLDRLPAGVPIARIDRAPLADDSVALGTALENPLDAEPDGGTASVGTHVWTGDFDGDDSCLDFSATSGDVGNHGITSEVDGDWPAAGSDACSTANRLYCFRPRCAAAPDTGCIDTFAKGTLSVSEIKAGKQKLRVKLARGPALSQADFGNPLSPGGTGYDVCLYDGAGGLVAEFEIDRAGLLCAGKPCWKATGGAPPTGKGYAYKDKDRSADGIQVMTFKSGAVDKSKILIKAGNSAPAGYTSLEGLVAQALSGSTAVTLQLHGSDAPNCYSITFD